MKIAVWIIALLANAVALLCLVNPWNDDWQSHAVVFFVIEGIFLIVVYLPVVAYQYYVKKRTLRHSFTAALDALMDMMTGWV